MQAESAALPETSEQADYLMAVADDLVRSFTSSHVTAERAEAIKLAFKDVLLVRYAMHFGLYSMPLESLAPLVSRVRRVSSQSYDIYAKQCAKASKQLVVTSCSHRAC